MVSTVLVTGFEPFNKASSNPSQAVVKRLNELGIPDLYFEVLPVEFGESARLLIRRIDEVKPDVVIALGQAEGRTQVTPERVAINVDDARIADNAGQMPIDQPIIKDGYNAYFSTLPIKEIVAQINAANIPAAVSSSAGTFVCNHLFYQLQWYCLNKGIKSGFIHLPLMDSQAHEFSGLSTLPLDELVKAVEIAIEVSQR
jgi:pyroglutamyl-peptidase